MGSYAAGKPWKEAKQQHILETAFRLFSDRGIERVTLPEIAKESGIGHATLYRYFNSKLDLVVAINTWQWSEYIRGYTGSAAEKPPEQMTGAESLRFFLDSFLDLYRSHRDLLRFNYEFNSFLKNSQATPEEKRHYTNIVEILESRFHRLYEKGRKDGTLNMDIPETMMFSSSFHIMLAAVTRYAVGLAYIPEGGGDPGNELVMLEDLLLLKFVRT